jgi:O-antigen/teichoic acid export membrane protein
VGAGLVARSPSIRLYGSATEGGGDNDELPQSAANMARVIQRLVFGTRLGRRLALLASSAAVGQAVVLLAAPVVTRLYAPDGYGAFVAMTGLLTLLAAFTGLRFEAAMPLCRRDEDASALAWVVFSSSATLSLAAAVALWAAGPWLAASLNLGGSRGLIWWLPLALAVQGLFLAFDGWALYQGIMRQLAWSKVFQGVVLATGQVAFGLIGHGNPHGLFLAFVLGQAAAISPMVLRLDRTQRALFARPSPRSMVRLARRYKQFPVYEVWSRSLSNGAEALPPLLTAGVFGPAAAGLYGLAQRIVGLPVRFLGISAAQVYIAELATLARDDRQALRSLFDETVRRLLAVGLVYAAVVMLLGPHLFGLVFGPAWAGSGELARVLAPMYLAMFVNRPIRYTVQFYERQDLALCVGAASLAVVLVSFLLAHLAVLTFTASILAMSAGLCATNVLSFLLARALISGRIAGYVAPDLSPAAPGPKET